MDIIICSIKLAKNVIFVIVRNLKKYCKYCYEETECSLKEGCCLECNVCNHYHTKLSKEEANELLK